MKATEKVRQRENFIALMRNYNEVLRAQSIEAGAAGLANERYAIYLDSTEAAMNRAKASWQGMWQATMNSGFIEFFYNASAAIANAITETGGLIPLATKVVGIFLILKREIINTKIQPFIALFKSLKLAIIDFNVSMKAIPLATTAAQAGMSNLAVASAGLFSKMSAGIKAFGKSLGAAGVVGLILTIGSLIWGIIDSIPTLSERIEELNTKLKESADEISNLSNKVKRIEDLSKEYEELSSKANKTIEDIERLTEIQNELKGISPDILGSYDEYGNFILSSTQDMKNLTAATLEQIETEKERLRLTSEAAANTNIQNLLNAFSKATKPFAETISPKFSPLSSSATAGLTYGIRTSLKDPLKQFEDEQAYKEALETAKESFSYMGDEAKKAFIKKLSRISPEIARIFENIIRDEYNQLLGDAMNKFYHLGDYAPDSTKTDEYGESLKKLVDSINAVVNASKEQSEQGYISNETAINLIGTNAKLAQFLTQTANGYLFDAEAAKQDAYQSMYNAFAKYNIASAAVVAAQGNYKFAASAIAAAQATAEEKANLLSLLEGFASLNFSVPSVGGGGGGGGAGKSAMDAEKEALQSAIDGLNKRKEKLQQQLEDFNKYIEAQKESLRLQKEADDYADSQAEKTKDLAKIKAQIAILSLDKSAEARAKRLQLEEEAAEIETDITEEREDRKYELQIDALDRAQKAEEERINALIDKIDALIDKLQEEMDAMVETAETGGAGMAEYGKTSEDSINAIKDRLKEQGIEFGKLEPLMETLIGNWLDIYGNEDMAFKKAKEYWQWLQNHEFVVSYRTTGDAQACFIAGTKITLSNGDTKNIEDIKIGDYVISCDLENNSLLIPDKVIETFEHHVFSTYIINNFLTVTGEHPFYVNNEWKNVCEINIGDSLYLIDGSNIIVENINIEYGSFIVYNIHTENIHNYFANNVLVHNKEWEGGTDTPGGGGGGASCCFVAGTKILMGNGSEKDIDNISINDIVMGYDGEKPTPVLVEELVRPIRYGIYTLLFDNNKILSLTEDHPLFSNNGWKAINPVASMNVYHTIDNIEQLQVGDNILTANNNYSSIIKIAYYPVEVQTYSFKVNKYERYFAEKFLTHNMQTRECHSGGLIEEHHDGNFAGGLKSNEVFAKLLKGEYVSTEGQMEHFIQNTLPSLSNVMANSNIKQGDIKLEMPINVAGSLDKAVIPDMKKIANQVISEVNKTLISRGHIRTANQTVS